MRKLFCLIIIILFFGEIVRSQNKPILLATIPSTFDDIGELINHNVADRIIFEFEKDAKSLFAVRICSNDPLPIAYASTDRGQFWAVKIIRERLDYFKDDETIRRNKERIYFLRNSDGCKRTGEGFHVEFWYVPSYGDLPEFKEFRKADEITIQNISDSENFDNNLFGKKEEKTLLNAESYQRVINRVKHLLITNKTAYLLIESYATKREKRIAQPKIDKLRKLLNQIGIGNHRIFIKKNRWTDAKNDIFPIIKIIYQEPRRTP